MTNKTDPTPDIQPEEDLEDVSAPLRPQPFYKQPGMIAAGVLVFLALVLLILWLTGKKSPAPSESTRTVAAPAVSIETQEKPVILVPPTETTAPAALAEPPTPEPTALPRNEVITHTILEGETVSSIAAKYNLWPETILWANRYELGDDIRDYTVGKTIYILPVDGVYHVWTAGEGLRAVSSYYGVTPEVIINYPANKLSAETVGSYSAPNIAAGTRLVVPGGTLPNYFASDTLLYYAALEKLRSLPVGTPETHPAPREEIIAYEVQ